MERSCLLCVDYGEQRVSDSPPEQHSCAWCAVETRALYAYAYNAVLAWDMYGAGAGDRLRAIRKMDELRTAVMHMYRPQLDAHFDAILPNDDPHRNEPDGTGEGA